MSDKFLTPEQYAEKFNITSRMARELAREGLVPAFKVGRLWRLEDKKPFERKEVNSADRKNKANAEETEFDF